MLVGDDIDMSSLAVSLPVNAHKKPRRAPFIASFGVLDTWVKKKHTTNKLVRYARHDFAVPKQSVAGAKPSPILSQITSVYWSGYGTSCTFPWP
jgi:hypothetical protein